MNGIHDRLRTQGFVRSGSHRVLGGVCAGLGQRLGIDPWPARLLFVLVLMVLPGSQLLLYPLLWLLMPLDEGVGYARSAPVAAAS